MAPASRLPSLLAVSFLGLAFATSLAGCSSKLSRFDVIQMQGRGSPLTVAPTGIHQLLRGETAAQGGGSAASLQHSLERVTIGGSYLRRSAAAAGGTSADSGLHSGRVH
ncbi:MAG: hypothetical protein NDJ90_11005 [Oligoflexia bacterium]|nr:hypothetical protein [Oligoflexia bacterium]